MLCSVLILFTHSFHLILLPKKLLRFSNNQNCQWLSSTLDLASSWNPSTLFYFFRILEFSWLFFFFIWAWANNFSYECPTGLLRVINTWLLLPPRQDEMTFLTLYFLPLFFHHPLSPWAKGLVSTILIYIHITLKRNIQIFQCHLLVISILKISPWRIYTDFMGWEVGLPNPLVFRSKREQTRLMEENSFVLPLHLFSSFTRSHGRIHS